MEVVTSHLALAYSPRATVLPLPRNCQMAGFHSCFAVEQTRRKAVVSFVCAKQGNIADRKKHDMVR